jgi:hypothetical protein
MSRRLKLVLGLVGLQAVAMLVVLGVTYVSSQTMLLRFSETFAARISRDTTAFTEGFLAPAGKAAQISRADHQPVDRARDPRPRSPRRPAPLYARAFGGA